MRRSRPGKSGWKPSTKPGAGHVSFRMGLSMAASTFGRFCYSKMVSRRSLPVPCVRWLFALCVAVSQLKRADINSNNYR